METLKITRMLGTLLLSLPGLMLTHSCSKKEALTVAPPVQASIEKREGLPHTKQYSADVANSWFNLLTTITKNTPFPPPHSIRIFVYSGLALYESVVPGMPSHQSMYTYLTKQEIPHDKKKDYYWPAAANAAMARLATRIILGYNPAFDLSSVNQLEAANLATFPADLSPDDLHRSMDFGRQIAEIIFEWSNTDGTMAPGGGLAFCAPYIPSGLPGTWVPTPPGFFPAAGACQGDLRPFLPGFSQVPLPAPPPPYSAEPGSAFYNMVYEVYENGQNLDPDEYRLSQAWRDILGVNYNTPTHLVRLTTEIITKEKLDLAEAAVLYARETIAVFDAIVAVFRAKFHYALLRPITYIHGEMGHPEWNPVSPTPQHPSYPSTSNAATAAAVEVLEQVFGESYRFTDSTQKALYGSWEYDSFNAMLLDQGWSRILIGQNFRQAVDAARIQGRQIGDLANRLPFKK